MWGGPDDMKMVYKEVSMTKNENALDKIWKAFYVQIYNI